jgi:5-methylcytosine-specific restriction endonuclease McrA
MIAQVDWSRLHKARELYRQRRNKPQRKKRYDRKERYAKYLKSDHWAALSASVRARDGNKCVECGSTENTHVHHLKYHERFQDSTPDELVTLCEKCHTKAHTSAYSEKKHPIRRTFGAKDLLKLLEESQEAPCEHDMATIQSLARIGSGQERRRAKAILKRYGVN